MNGSQKWKPSVWWNAFRGLNASVWWNANERVLIVSRFGGALSSFGCLLMIENQWFNWDILVNYLI